MPERNLDFDTITDRRNTNSLKYDFAAERGKPADVLPLWVADMDFKTSSYIEDALIERCRHAIFGYSEVKTPYFEAVRDWMIRHHGWEPQEDWLIKTTGVVNALALAVQAYTKPGEAVLLQEPVYYPFSEVITDNARKRVSSDLVLGEDFRYHIDFEDFERKIIEHGVKLFLLCSPHNPGGRVWTREELTRMGDICLRHGVIVVSDEIHADFVFKGTHTVFSTIRPEFEDNCVICTAASKTFNLASMLNSNIFIPNPVLRQKFKKRKDASGMSQIGILGFVATETAYRQGEEWYQAMLSYIKENIAYTKQFVKKQIPGVRMMEPEGTYLVWLDFHGTGLSDREVDDRIIHKAKLWLDTGAIFGPVGEGFQRICVACPRSILTEALKRIRDAILI